MFYLNYYFASYPNCTYFSIFLVWLCWESEFIFPSIPNRMAWALVLFEFFLRGADIKGLKTLAPWTYVMTFLICVHWDCMFIPWFQSLRLSFWVFPLDVNITIPIDKLEHNKGNVPACLSHYLSHYYITRPVSVWLSYVVLSLYLPLFLCLNLGLSSALLWRLSVG